MSRESDEQEKKSFYKDEKEEDRLVRSSDLKKILDLIKNRKEKLIELKDKMNTEEKTAEDRVQAVLDARTYFYQQLWFQNEKNYNIW